MRQVTLPVAVMAVVTLALACGDSDSSPTTPPDDGPPPGEAEVAATAADGWSLTAVARGAKPALALDATGAPAVAFLLEALPAGYVQFAAASEGWSTQTVAEGYFYGPLELAFDPAGRPNIVWHNHEDTQFRQDLGNLMYSVREAGGWQVLTAEDDGHDGWDSTIAIGEDGVVHAAGIDPAQFGRSDGVEHYRLEDGEFVVTSIGSGAIEYEWNVSLAVGPDGSPALTYFNHRDRSLVFAGLDGGDWVLETVAGGGDVGRFSSLAFGPDGRPHVTFYEVTSPTTGTVHYAVRDGDAWTVEPIADLSSVELGMLGARRITAVGVSSDGRPHAAFTDRSGLWYAVRGGGGWEVEEVLTGGGEPLGQQVSFAVGDDGTPHLATFEVTGRGQPPSGVEGVILYLTPGG